MNPSTYLLCVSFNDFRKGERIIQQFISSNNKKEAKLLLIENGKLENYKNYKQKFKAEKSVELFYSKSPNKSKCLNYLINDVINEDEALIICIDNDIEFNNDFIARYKKTAFSLGKDYYFGGGLIVPKAYSNLIDNDFKKLYQGSQFSRTDEDFKKMKSLMFFGANFSFFKSQWRDVNGFDERFSPGSKYGLAGQESVFQKKLKYLGYQPHYVSSNEITHYPKKESYTVVNIKRRTIQNGLSHGTLNILNSVDYLKADYFKSLFKTLKYTVSSKLAKKKQIHNFRKYYSLGFIKSLVLYIKIKNKKSIYNNLNKKMENYTNQ